VWKKIADVISGYSKNKKCSEEKGELGKGKERAGRSNIFFFSELSALLSYFNKRED
jgi:hypothetical protein